MESARRAGPGTGARQELIVAKRRRPTETWKDEPDAHDYPAAAAYLSLLFPEGVSSAIVGSLEQAVTIRRKAKDLMRASGLPLLPEDDPEVAKDLRKVARGEPLSPVLLVRGKAPAGRSLIVADGYHRICASYHLDENADIPCRLADPP
jgi:hypothetical protein